MRLLFFVNLILIVVLAGALARMYEGTPLPWLAHRAPATGLASQTAPAPVPASAPVTAPEAAKRPVLRILTEGDYPPFNYRDGQGRLKGFDIDMAEALCARMKRDCRIEARPWTGLLPALSHGEGDAIVSSMLIPSPGREGPPGGGSVVFTKKYYSTPGHFAARKTSAPIAASAAAMAGKRVAVQKGSIHEAFLAHRFPSVEIVAVPTLEDGETALAQGRVDFLFADRNALLRWRMSGTGESCCRLVGADYADPTYFGTGAGIALRAGDKALREDFDHALAAIAADGTYAEISSRYFGQSIR